MTPSNDTPSTVDPRIAFFDDLADRWDDSGQDKLKLSKDWNSEQDCWNCNLATHVLEIGCGTGQITGWLAEQVTPGRVVAVDFSSEMLRGRANQEHSGNVSIGRYMSGRSW